MENFKFFIDTHVHLNYEDYTSDLNFKEKVQSLEQVISDSIQNNVEVLINISADYSKIEKVKKISDKYSNVFFTIGVHPSYEEEYWEYREGILALYNNLIQSEKLVAVGEIGLDYHYSDTIKDKQRTMLEEQINIALNVKLPIVFHVREAEEDILSIIKQFDLSSDKIPFVMHSYTGDKKWLKSFLDRGAYVGFNGIITFKNASNVRGLVEFTPIDRIVLETDAPFLAPHPYRGKINYPKYIPIIAQKVSELKQLDIESVKEITTKNAFNLFGLDNKFK